MDVVGGEEADAGMVVVGVVPGKEIPTVGAGVFLTFWKSHSGNALFGAPISQPLYEQNGDGTGRTYLVQYFQNARMEYHPELAGTENRIAVERRKYNETVQRYNTDIELFPNNIAASMFHFERNDAYFKTEPGARNAPKVSF